MCGLCSSLPQDTEIARKDATIAELQRRLAMHQPNEATLGNIENFTSPKQASFREKVTARGKTELSKAGGFFLAFLSPAERAFNIMKTMKTDLDPNDEVEQPNLAKRAKTIHGFRQIFVWRYTLACLCTE